MNVGDRWQLEACPSRGGTRAKDRPVAPFRQLDYDRIGQPLARVILNQFVAQPSCFGAHYRIDTGIKRFVLSKYLDPDEVFLQLISLPAVLLVYDKPQKAAELLGRRECPARKNLFECASDGLRRTFFDRFRSVRQWLPGIAGASVDWHS
jgi:hypothetical protein